MTILIHLTPASVKMTGDEQLNEIFELMEEQGIATDIESKLLQGNGGAGEGDVMADEGLSGGAIENQRGVAMAIGGVRADKEDFMDVGANRNPRAVAILKVIGRGVNIEDVYDDPALFKLLQELVAIKVITIFT